MKNLVLIFSILFIAISCDPDTPDVNKGKLDPNAMILLKPAKGVQLRSTVTGLTALEVVEQARAIVWQSHYLDNAYYTDVKSVGRSFREEQKDYNIPALKMYGFDVITVEGEYYKSLTYAFNVFITDSSQDTIAYIPDAVINTARPLIEAAYENEDYDEVYRLFNEAFTFLPIE